MNTRFRMVLCALAAVVPAGGLVRADGGAAPATGHVLVLDNERLLQGDVERQGRQYRVRRSSGETFVAADSVRCVCADVEAAYAFLRAEANLRDPDERLRLARWCHSYGLRAQAVAEATAAVALRPEDADCKMMLHLLRQEEADVPAAKPAPAAPPPAAAPEVPDVPVDAQVLGQFVTHVQPILMNTCARCHAGDRSGAFKLVRAYGTAGASQRATRLNLAATLRQLDRDTPEASPLLLKAVAIHGDVAQPPLKDRQTPAYRLLEQWVRQEVATAGPQTGGPVAARPAPAPRPKAKLPAEPAVAFASERQALPAHAHKPTTAAPVATSAWAADSKAAEAKPAAAAAVPAPAAPVPVDPFDPLIFNREMHPEVMPQGGG
jgi:hypothetical protein